jgi:hypothetical protein
MSIQGLYWKKADSRLGMPLSEANWYAQAHRHPFSPDYWRQCPGNSIENFDPMGVHTGDSITVAPIQTLTDKEYQIMRDASFAVIRAVGVETGGSNIQFAVNPDNGRMVIIEMNPRVSRS